MRKMCYTLIELLTVITIIALLQGMVFPAIGIVKKKAKVSAAKQEMNTITVAVSAFEQEYGRFPTGKNEGGSASELTVSGSSLLVDDDDDVFYGISDLTKCVIHQKGSSVSDAAAVRAYYNFFDVLTCSCHLDADKKDLEKTVVRQNSQKRRFLEVKDGYFSADEKNCGYRDPWGNTYVIALDAGGDGKITIPAALSADGKKMVVHKSVCVISVGQQSNEIGTSAEAGKMDKKEFIYSWK